MDRVNAETNADSLVKRANAMRDDQLRDLLTIRGMWGRSSSSSSTARPFKNIFKESDDGGADKLIAELIDRECESLR